MTDFYKYLFVFLSFFYFNSGISQVNKQKELEEKRQAILNEIKQINNLLFATQKEEKSVLTQVEDLNSKIKARQNLIRVTNQQANYLSREINNNLTKINLLETELKDLKEDYASMILKSYKSKSQHSRIMFLLSSESFLQAYKRLQYMNQYAKHRKLQGENIKKKSIVLEELNQVLTEDKNKKEILIDDNKLAKTKLSKELEDQSQLVLALKKDENKFALQIQKKQKEAIKIDREIEKLIRDAIAAANRKNAKKRGAKLGSSKKFALTPEAKLIAVDFTKNKGKLPWPVKNGVVVKRFGNTQHPQLPNVTTYCSGVEITTDKNAKVRAVFNGEVMEIQKIKGAAKAVFIQHGNYITIYQNMINVTVKKGDKVMTKQEIGSVATKGSSGKSILKFLVYQNDKKMNPASWIYKL
ncbi:MAG: peptidoglycan DD-metalloendopeptidase family protein [Flavobacteriaceae bacterium]|nr:peptidoglycan DD-metalloendopeptidase family protein [Flavobacteriaceae bacterium]|tara:strand:- start:107831 stop:109066 length:1236 start_codon:yes stop_codon:yes gene_type:complete